MSGLKQYKGTIHAQRYGRFVMHNKAAIQMALMLGRIGGVFQRMELALDTYIS